MILMALRIMKKTVMSVIKLTMPLATTKTTATCLTGQAPGALAESQELQHHLHQVACYIPSREPLPQDLESSFTVRCQLESMQDSILDASGSKNELWKGQEVLQGRLCNVFNKAWGEGPLKNQ